MTNRIPRARDAGFSLLEVLVAMALTLVVSGSVFMLLTVGQKAFRREPQVTERQQNVRAAMSWIVHDVASAGEEMPALLQIFNPGLAGVLGTDPVGPDGAPTDEMQMLTNPWHLGSEPGCGYDVADAATARIMAGATPIVAGESVVVFAPRAGGLFAWGLRRVTGVSTPDRVDGSCGGAPQQHVSLDFDPADPFDPGNSLNPPGGLCSPGGVGDMAGGVCALNRLTRGQVVSYRIRLHGDYPVLERRSSEDWNAGFVVVARGIEDLQVDYQQADTPGVWRDSAPAVTGYGSIVTNVRIRLSGRAEDVRIEGAMRSTSGSIALRGRLESIVAVNSSLTALAQAPGGISGHAFWN